MLRVGIISGLIHSHLWWGPARVLVRVPHGASSSSLGFLTTNGCIPRASVSSQRVSQTEVILLFITLSQKSCSMTSSAC